MSLPTATFLWRGFADEQFAEFPEHFMGAKDVKMSVVTDFAYNVAERVVICRAVVDFYQEGNLFLRCGINGGFEIEPNAWNSRIQEDGAAILLERGLHIHFATFTIGGLRGYLHARQQRAQLPAFMGPINVLDILPEEEVWAIPLG